MSAEDRIVIQGIEIWAHHGVGLDERDRGQPFFVHVTLDVDLADAAASDELTDTVDYAEVSAEVADIVRGGPHQLLEKVAGDVAQALLRRERVRGVEVTVEKPHAPLPVPAAGVAVTVRRTR